MRIRSVLVFLLSAGLIVLGAMLPRLVGDRQDAANDNRVDFAPVNEVQLEFTENEMTMWEKLVLSGYIIDSVVIPEQLAVLTQDKVMEIARQTMEQYRQNGLIPEDMGEIRPNISCQPMLLYGSSEQSNVFWDVVLYLDGVQWTLHLIVDDQTGRVCRIEYTNYAEESVYDDMETSLFRFCELYLAGLGEEFFDFEPQDLVENARKPADGSYIAAEITWEAADSGSYRITLFLRQNGFYIYANMY